MKINQKKIESATPASRMLRVATYRCLLAACAVFLFYTTSLLALFFLSSGFLYLATTLSLLAISYAFRHTFLWFYPLNGHLSNFTLNFRSLGSGLVRSLLCFYRFILDVSFQNTSMHFFFVSLTTFLFILLLPFFGIAFLALEMLSLPFQKYPKSRPV
jgi:hypothetical protein